MKQTVLVTGSNRGIGLELCRQLAAEGLHVIATCRAASSQLKLLDLEIIEGVEVRDINSLGALAEKLEGREIDWLINNAGIAGGFSINDIDENALADFLRMYQVNSLGPLLVTQTLLPNIKSGGKVGIITSRMGSIADNDSGGSYAYRMSKSAVNAAGKSLSIDLAPKGIAVGILHPGWVRTDMTGYGGLVDPDESAAGLIQRIKQLNLENSGTFWHMNGDVLPW